MSRLTREGPAAAPAARTRAIVAALALLAGLAAPEALRAADAPAWPITREGDLYVLQTPHYTFKSDHNPDTIQTLATQQEALFRELYKRMSKTRPVSEIRRMLIYVYQTEEAYKKAMGKAADGSKGIYTSKAIGGYGDDLDKLLATYRHEGTHQFIDQFLGAKCPIWLNEGLAVYYENASFVGGELKTGQVPDTYVSLLRQALEGNTLIPVKEMMAITPEDWAAAVAGKATQTSLRYAEAWSMVHFLEHGDDGKYRTPFMQYLYFLARGSPADAWRRVFGANLAGFETRWRAYLQGLKPGTLLPCRQQMDLLGRWIAQFYGRHPEHFKDIESFREAARGGAFGYFKLPAYQGLPAVDIRGPKAIGALFRCPDDPTPGDKPSYELVAGKQGELPILRCTHHAGIVYETEYQKNPVTNQISVGVVSKPAAGGR